MRAAGQGLGRAQGCLAPCPAYWPHFCQQHPALDPGTTLDALAETSAHLPESGMETQPLPAPASGRFKTLPDLAVPPASDSLG